MLNTKVKASSVTHLTDARYFAAWEVEWLGFQLTPGADHYLPPHQVAAFQEWVDGVKICGEFGMPDIEELNTAIDLLQLKAVQVSLFTPLSTLKALEGRVEILQELVVENYTDISDLETVMENNHAVVDYFILQCSKGGIQWSDIVDGIPFSLAKLQEWAAKYSILIDVHLDGEMNAGQLLEKVSLKGYAVIGGEEEKVGLKNFEELDDFFEDLEVLI